MKAPNQNARGQREWQGEERVAETNQAKKSLRRFQCVHGHGRGFPTWFCLASYHACSRKGLPFWLPS